MFHKLNLLLRSHPEEHASTTSVQLGPTYRDFIFVLAVDQFLHTADYVQTTGGLLDSV